MGSDMRFVVVGGGEVALLGWIGRPGAMAVEMGRESD